MARFKPSGTSTPVAPKPAVKSISMPFSFFPGAAIGVGNGDAGGAGETVEDEA